jgi:hypothetical protein
MLDEQNGFFAHLAERMEYIVSRETLRVDQIWRDSEKKVVVALEHEGWWTGIERELENLSAVDAPLKVLVTYVRNTEHGWRPIKLAEQVKKHLSETAEKNDFLLIVGNNAANEWVGFKFIPEYTFRVDVIPPPTPGLRHT